MPSRRLSGPGTAMSLGISITNTSSFPPASVPINARASCRVPSAFTSPATPIHLSPAALLISSVLGFGSGTTFTTSTLNPMPIRFSPFESKSTGTTCPSFVTPMARKSRFLPIRSPIFHDLVIVGQPDPAITRGTRFAAMRTAAKSIRGKWKGHISGICPNAGVRCPLPGQ